MEKHKIKSVSIVFLILVLITSAIITIFPSVAAQGVYTKKTYSFIGATPNPVGVNQETLLHAGITDEMQTVEDGYEGITITVEKPNGETETLGPIRTDSTGGTGWIYIPDIPGTYYLQTNFPGQWYNWTTFGTADIWFEESHSEKLELTVTEDPVEYYQDTPLPTGYWSRPIDAQHYTWYQISGSWLTLPGAYGADGPDNKYARFNNGPETAHVLWRNPLMVGGIGGGRSYAYQVNVGGGGQSPWASPTILNGILIYNKYYQGEERQVVAIDVHTGETLWTKNDVSVDFGQQFEFDAANQHASFSYWWEVTGGFDFFTMTTEPEVWNAYDPFTGRWVYSMTDVPSGTSRFGPKGEILRYVVDLENGWIAMWNSTAVVTSGGGGGWSPDGSTYNASATTRYDYMAGGLVPTNVFTWNVSIPTGLPGSVRAIYNDDVMLGYDRGGTVLTRVEAGLTLDNPPVTGWAVSLEPSSRGDLMWKETYELPPENLTIVFGAASQEDRVWTIWCKETKSHTAFDLDTGDQLWGPSESQAYMDQYGISEVCGSIVDGKLISVAYAGIVYCYDVRNGDLLWTYEGNDPYNEILWSNNWPLKTTFITDGKIYLAFGEHSPIAPLARGAPFICLDIDNGNEVWRIDGAFRGAEWGGNAIIGDSVMVEWNSYDNIIYGVSKGPTAITVSAPSSGIALGKTVILQGSVLDISPATQEIAITKRFPNGVPAVADESMSGWMKHVYMQFECPTDIAGVEVKLEAIDANGNYQFIGTTTTDLFGNYGIVFEPEITGRYQIIASFEGSKAYYESACSTYLSVDAASTASSPMDIEEPSETTEPAATETPIITTELALVIVAVIAAIVGISAYWILKRK
ncbi:MAG: PQQ-binding-like beta-propeller repeat protein [Candidatus Bathyarchaeota archaeon]|nr:PQQ-binding-like beta-propeller repeat protein [Candidatus Bathyarchaeum sp.]